MILVSVRALADLEQLWLRRGRPCLPPPPRAPPPGTRPRAGGGTGPRACRGPAARGAAPAPGFGGGMGGVGGWWGARVGWGGGSGALDVDWPGRLMRASPGLSGRQYGCHRRVHLLQGPAVPEVHVHAAGQARVEAAYGPHNVD